MHKGVRVVVGCLFVLALAGCSRAPKEYQKGQAYFKGHGVPKNDKKAVYWYRKAAHKGYPKAENSLGNAYGSGQGVPQNQTKEVYWLRKAAHKGYARAEDMLGAVYYEGTAYDFGPNYKKAVYWWRKAARQGYPGAELGLGNAYYYGHGVPQDYVKAYKWADITRAGEKDRNSSPSLGVVNK